MKSLSEEISDYRMILNKTKEVSTPVKSKFVLTESIEPALNALVEKWGAKLKTPDTAKGMFKGKNKSELESELSAAKEESKNLHDAGKKESEHLKKKIKRLEFALRAKNDFGKVNESQECTHVSSWWKEMKPCFACGEPYSDEEAERISRENNRAGRQFSSDQEEQIDRIKSDDTFESKVNEAKEICSICGAPKSYGLHHGKEMGVPEKPHKFKLETNPKHTENANKYWTDRRRKQNEGKEWNKWQETFKKMDADECKDCKGKGCKKCEKKTAVKEDAWTQKKCKGCGKVMSAREVGEPEPKGNPFCVKCKKIRKPLKKVVAVMLESM